MMIVQWWSIKIHSSFSSGFPAIRYSKTFGSTIDQFCCDVLLHSSTFGGEALRWPEGSLLWVTYEPYGPWIWYTVPCFSPLGLVLGYINLIINLHQKRTGIIDDFIWSSIVAENGSNKSKSKTQHVIIIYIWLYNIARCTLYISINIICVYIYTLYRPL